VDGDRVGYARKGKLEVHDEPGRTLVINSATREGQIWIASIEYGPTGKTLSISARVERQRGATTLTFPISTTSTVDLSLVSETELRGLLKISDSSGSWVGPKMRLQKTGDDRP
jgi:hypothetical protein